MTSERCINAAKSLVKRYREITIDDVDKIFKTTIDSFHVATELTGFGYALSCKLCRATSWECEKCIYTSSDNKNHCIRGENEETYDAIKDAKTPEKLIEAIRNRADHIEKILKKLEE